MKTTNKVFLVGMISVVLAFGFVLASCVFEGKDTVTAKDVKLTLSSAKYKIEFNGKTYKGGARTVSAAGIDTYTWTSGGTGGVTVKDKKEVTLFSYKSTDGSVDISSTDMKKRSVVSGEISLDDIELIIEE